MQSPFRFDRLARLTLLAGSVATAVTAIFAWWTRAGNIVDDKVTVRPTESRLVEKPAVLLPDQGEPRSERRGQIEQVVQRIRHDPGRLPEALADTLLSQAQTDIDLERYASAQAAIDEIKQLLPSADSWQHRHARLLQQILVHLETGDSRVRQLHRDLAHHHVDALHFQATGEYVKAIGEAREAVKLARTCATESSSSDRNTAFLARLAEELLLLGRLMQEHSTTYLQSHDILRDARDRCASTLGESHPLFAQVLAAQAAREDDRGDFDTANRLYEQSLEIIRRTRGELSLDFASVLSCQGRMHLEWWEDYAWGKCFRAMQIREQLLGRDHLECAGSLEDLGINAFDLLQFEKAESLLRTALTLRERAQGNSHPETARVKSWLSQCTSLQGDMAQSHLLQRQAIATAEHHRGPEHPQLIRLLVNLGRLATSDWNESRGLRACRRALEIARQQDVMWHPAALEAQMKLGELVLLEEETFGFSHVRELDLEGASRAFKDAIATHERTPRASQLPTYPASLLGCAHLGYFTGYSDINRADARELIDRAWRNIQKYGGDLHPGYAEYFWTLGRWHLWNGDYEEAFPNFKEHVRLVDRRYGTLVCGQRHSAMIALAGCHIHQGTHSTEFDELFQSLTGLSDELFLRSAKGQSELDRLCLSRKRFYIFAAALAFHAPDIDLGESYRSLLRIRGATTAIQASARLVHDHAELDPLVEHVRDARQQLSELVFHTPHDPTKLSEWGQALILASDAKEDVERELAVATRHLLPPFQTLDLQEVQQALPADGAFIDCLQYEAFRSPPNHRGRLVHEMEMAAFVIRPNRPPQCVLLGPAAAIEEAIQKWRKQLEPQDEVVDSQAAADAAEAVSDLVWKPLASHLEGVTTILIAPDGPLCFLSFAAMPSASPGHYLVEDYVFGYVPSARQLVDNQLATRQPTNEGLLTVGDIHYGSQSASHGPLVAVQTRGLIPENASWTDLPGSKAEIEHVESLFTQSAPSQLRARLTEKSATIEEFRQVLAKPWRSIHFAGHGFFADSQFSAAVAHRPMSTNPVRIPATDELMAIGRSPLLLSGLALAPANERASASSNIMTAEEVAGLDLRGTELVTLSACETGLGRTPQGEGVLGLQRAFLTAGAQSTLTCLWKVDDEATNVLMDRFYRYLWMDNKSKWEALQKAQLDVLNDAGLIQQQRVLLASRGIVVGRTKPIATRTPTTGPYAMRAPPALWGAFVVCGDGR